MLLNEVEELFEESTASDRDDTEPIIGHGSYSKVYQTRQGGKVFALKRLPRCFKQPTTRHSLLAETH